MSSSSSDSDSDDIEPIRKIKINIKPKDYVAKKEGADIEAIKASVEAWRPLGPRPHHTLARRQSSLSSMSSLSFGTGSNQGGVNSTTATPNSVSSATANNQYSDYQLGAHNATTSNTAGSGALFRGNISTEAAATAATTTTTTTTNFMRSSPSCSSLVNEFNTRTSFSNFMSNASRTSSPQTFMGGNGVAGGGANYSETSVPIALAIQESIELTVRGHQGRPDQVAAGGVGGEMKTRFETRALGNIKVAFPNSFARLCSMGASDKPIPALKLRLDSTENIVRYYASGLVKDLDSENSSLAGSVARRDSFTTINNNIKTSSNSNNANVSLDNTSCSTSTNGSEHHQELGENNYDLFDMNESPARRKGSTKIIEFDMVALVAQLKQLYDQTSSLRYYNVDVLRYQITPLDEFEKCPLQVCAYWKVEPELIKLRVDFKHSNLSGLTLERLREISFTANLSNLVPANLSAQPVSPHLVSKLMAQTTQARTASTDSGRDGTRNLASDADNSRMRANRGHFTTTTTTTTAPLNLLSTSTSFQIGQANGAFQVPPQPAPRQINNSKNSSALPIRLPPPPSASSHSRSHHHHSRASNLSTGTSQMTGMDTLRRQQSPFTRNQSGSSSSGRSDNQSVASGQSGGSSAQERSSLLDQLLGLSQDTTPQPHVENSVAPLVSQPSPPRQQQPPQHAHASLTVPYITYEPQAHWDNQTKQLVWRFDNLLSFYKSDGFGSLLAKLDFRGQQTNDGGGGGGNSIGETQASEQQHAKPNPIDIKFMVVDSTLSKISLTIDSAGYRMSLLKREVRSGRYKSEPYIF